MATSDSVHANDNRHVVESVEQLFDVLSVSNELWAGARMGDLAFRGQADSMWGLVPKAFRASETLGYTAGAQGPPLSGVVPQAEAEFAALRQFVKAADEAGLDTGSAGKSILMFDDPSRIFDDQEWMYSWPQDGMLEVLALAQHHGVPTRLLDFTADPLIASFFAAESVWSRAQEDKKRNDTSAALAIWVVDLRFVRAIDAVRHRYRERVAEIRLPRARNSFLHAQAGFFLMDRGANDLMHTDSSRSLADAILQRAEFWHTAERLREGEVEKTWFAERPIRKIEFPKSAAGDLLIELEGRGVTKGRVMPSLDRVVEGLRLSHRVAQEVLREHTGQEDEG